MTRGKYKAEPIFSLPQLRLVNWILTSYYGAPPASFAPAGFSISSYKSSGWLAYNLDSQLLPRPAVSHCLSTEWWRSGAKIIKYFQNNPPVNRKTDRACSASVLFCLFIRKYWEQIIHFIENHECCCWLVTTSRMLVGNIQLQEREG